VTTLASWNIGDGKDARKAGGLTELLHQGAQVLALQEAGDRRRMLEHWCELHDWEPFFGDEPGAPSVPILWNPRAVNMLGAGTRPATPATKVGPLGAGPSTMKPKVWNRARFEIHDRDADLLVINGHIVPSVYLPKRRRLAAKQIEVLADMVEFRETATERDLVDVAALGDFNMRPSHELLAPLRQLGMRQRVHEPTHGRFRTIDHGWTLGCPAAADAIDMPGDHRGVVLTTKESR